MFIKLMTKTPPLKTACKDDSGYIAQLTRQKLKQVIITYQHIAIKSMC